MEFKSGKRALYFFGITILLVTALFTLLREECYQAEAADKFCLASAYYPLSVFAQTSRFLSHYPWVYFTIAMAFAAFAVWRLAWRARHQDGRQSWKTLYLATVFLALGGELAALLQVPFITLTLHTLSFGTALATFLSLSRTSPELISAGWIEPNRPASQPRRPEIAALVVILLAVFVTRFYALNRMPYFFDGEACPHRPITMSWTKILEQEAGQNIQQSSGMSWPFLHMWFTRAEHPTEFYLDQRTLGVGISLVACLIVFWGFRWLCGPFTALLALVVYAFGPLDLGWSRLPVLHHLPVAVGMLLAIASLSAFSAPSWKSFFAVSVLIALTKFVYPSAKLLALGPALGALGVLVWHRREWKGHKRKLAFVALGGCLFLTARPFILWLTTGTWVWVSPFPIMQIQPLADSPWGLVKAHAWEAFGFLYEIFYGQFDTTNLHWTHHAAIDPPRSVTSVCAVFATLAVARLCVTIRDPRALVALGLLIGGLIPAISSGLSERRIAFSLVFISCLAALELSWLINTFIRQQSSPSRKTVKAVAIACLGTMLFMSNTHYFVAHSSGKHMQLIMTEEIRPRLTDGTLVVQLGADYRCEIFYGIYDILKAHDGRIGYTNPVEAERTVAEFVTTPYINPNAWFYRDTALKSQLATLASAPPWSRYLFITQYTDTLAPLLESLRTTYPNGTARIIQTEEATRLRFLVFETSK